MIKKVKNETELLYGKEPVYDKKIKPEQYMIELSRGLTYYRNVVSNTDKKKWILAWAKENGYDESLVDKIGEDYLGSIGAAIRMQSRGFPLKEKDVQSIKDKLNALVRQTIQPETQETQEGKKPGEIDAKGQKLGRVIYQFDEIFDQLSQEKLTKSVVPEIEESLNVGETSEIVEYIRRQINDLSEEGYEQTKPVLTRMKKFGEDFIRTIEEKLNKDKAMKAAVRKPRKKKPQLASKKVENVNYKVADTEYGLTSLNPEKMLGAKMLVLFNSKTRVIQLYYADDAAMGLQIKGSTLKNFNADVSKGRMLRKPQEFFKAVTTKKRVEDEFETLTTTKKDLTGRINSDTIILKVY
jgi:hypothetical protein